MAACSGAFQFFKSLGDLAGLAAVSRDGFEKCYGSAVMHQTRAQSDSPQRSSTNLVPAALEVLFREITGHLLEDLVSIVLARGLQDSVPGAHIVHQEIPVRVQGE